MLYNRLYNLLVKARDNGDIASLASECSVSKQTLRSQLESLDDGLPCSLYSRLDCERVELSDAGLAYASACEKANRLFIEAELKAEKYKRQIESTVALGTLSKSADSILRSSCPYKLKVRFFDSLSGPLPNDIDVALGLFDEALLRRNRLKAVSLGQKRLAVALSASSPLASRKRLDIEDLYENTLFVPKLHLIRKIDTLVQDLRAFHQRIALEQVDAVDRALLARVSEENGMLLCAQSLDLSPFGLRCIPVDWNYSVSYGLLYRQKPDGRVARLVEALEGALEGK